MSKYGSESTSGVSTILFEQKLQALIQERQQQDAELLNLVNKNQYTL